MKYAHPRAVALAVALVAIGTLALVPDETEAGSNCLPGELRSKLSQVSKKFGKVQVLSTYRRGARMPSGRTSFHASCRAVDFKPPAGKYSQVASWLKANHSGGVGTYSCGMNHIHLDTGPRVRFHHCQSAALEEMDGDAIRAAKAEWPTEAGRGQWPLVLPTAGTPNGTRL